MSTIWTGLLWEYGIVFHLDYLIQIPDSYEIVEVQLL